MKKYSIYFVIFITVIACDSSSKEKSNSEVPLEGKEESTEVLKLVDILDGKWKSEGNDGTVSNFLEFESSSKEFYAWVADESKPATVSGSYEIIGDTLLQLTYPEFNYQEHFAFDSIAENYMDMFSLGVSAGNLIYEKQD
tara:strand:- start:342 stop:761 length:420 start_codon:yes stop_codon:yes gene_type:complete